jgi:hypothetical protein
MLRRLLLVHGNTDLIIRDRPLTRSGGHRAPLHQCGCGHHEVGVA